MRGNLPILGCKTTLRWSPVLDTLGSRAVGRSENPGVPVLIRWEKSAPPPLVEIGLTDLPKSGCGMAHPAHPGTTGLGRAIFSTVV